MRRVEVVDEHIGWEPGCTWLRRHGLDPYRVLVSGGNEIEMDDGARTIRIERYAKVDACGNYLVVAGDVATETLVVQLESPALPWPGPVER